MEKKHYIAFGLSILTLALVLFFKNNSSSPQFTNKSKELKTVSISNNEKKSSDKSSIEKTKGQKTKVNSADLDNVLDEISSHVSKCQNTIKKLFPETDDSSLPYSKVSEIKDAVTRFYQVTNQKLEYVGKVIDFFESNDTSSLDPKITFEKISNIDDCGDFEEENIVDSVVSFLSEYTFSKEEKKSVAKHLIKNFINQLDRPVGLHHLVSKVESIETMIDEGIVPTSLESELSEMNQTLEDIEDDFRTLIPKNFAQKEYLTPKEILLLRSREDDVLNKIRGPLKDFLNQVQQELSL